MGEGARWNIGSHRCPCGGLGRPGRSSRIEYVKDFVAGSGLAFRERGSEHLKGVPGEWRLFAVER